MNREHVYDFCLFFTFQSTNARGLSVVNWAKKMFFFSNASETWQQRGIRLAGDFFVVLLATGIVSSERRRQWRRRRSECFVAVADLFTAEAGKTAACCCTSRQSGLPDAHSFCVNIRTSRWESKIM
jgi:hypothetical protein